MSSTDVTCNDNGLVNASFNTGSYHFVWSNGIVDTNIGNSTAHNLNIGIHCVSITDLSTGCLDTFCVQVNLDTTAPGVQTNTTSISCFGAADGCVTIETINGTAPYTYVWDTVILGSQVTTSTNYTVCNLPPKLYTVTSTDAAGCNSVASFEVVSPSPLDIVVRDTVHPICGSNGRIEVEVFGGTGTLDYTWSTGDSTLVLENLAAGQYCMTATDANHCSTVLCLDLIQQQTLTATANLLRAIDCYGDSACIDVQVVGGSGNYTYTIHQPNLLSQTDSVFCYLPADTTPYQITIIDSNYNCMATTSILIAESSPLAATLVSSNGINCHGDSTGSITVAGTGGTVATDYTYDWSTGDSTPAISNLRANVPYCVTVTDDNGCFATVCHSLTEPNAALSLTIIEQSGISCHGGSDGVVEAIALGGTGGLSYIWDANVGSATSSLATGLGAGTYCVTVTDSLGCMLDRCITIGEPSALVATVVSSSGINCHGDSTGSITVAGTGGTVATDYTYDWSTGDSTPTISNLRANVPYCVTVTDDNGCFATVCHSLTEPNTALSLTIIEQSGISCHGGLDGVVEANALGGTGGLSYVWDANAGGGISNIVTGLGAGTYCVTVTDSLGCVLDRCITIGEPSPLILVVDSVNHVNCNGGCTGAIGVTGVGGVGGYAYSWSTGDSVATIINLCAGGYVVSMTDSNGCVVLDSVLLTEPLTPLSGGIVDNGDGTATAFAMGGTAGYTYQWGTLTGNQTTATATGLVHNGTYHLTITDANGCAVGASITVNIVGLESINNLTHFAIFPNPNDGRFRVEVAFSKSQTTTIRLTNVLGQIVKEHTYSASSFDLLLDLRDQASGVYLLTLEVDQQYQSQKVIIAK
ncbi:T9SS type A sorting domain-containing protein [Aureispira sp. CCB-E]|uniref:T9SS type A sorting domain-containing protein n=1 Tax=Aureispira sp. CCB-E TaxID=3051121 RepID=UPI0028696DF2|nr:T9SS type A sorting domain-containing protein [Aureispira sp. CCB-E]WMX16259.1 T9SS type A sorting domain-containing protein [Aureispira sp. CCB-E]